MTCIGPDMTCIGLDMTCICPDMTQLRYSMSKRHLQTKSSCGSRFLFFLRVA
jgi:hypothetical protein